MVNLSRMNFAFVFLVFPLAYFWSFFLMQSYIAGDQIHYRRFYEAISNSSLNDAFALARAYISASESLTILTLWVGARIGVPKDHYISFFNAILLTQIFFILKKYRAGLVVMCLLMTNYYVIVLMTGAERLKFAYIFLASAVLFGNYAKSAFVLISPLAHFQSLLFFPSILLVKFYNDIKIFFGHASINKKKAFVFFVACIFVFTFILFFYPFLKVKAEAYFGTDRAAFGLLNLAVLFFLSVLASRDWKRMFLVLLPFFPIIFLLGGERGNMVAVTIALWLLMVERRLNHPAVLIMLFYFSFKSIGFIQNILLYGDGFAFG